MNYALLSRLLAGVLLAAAVMKADALSHGLPPEEGVLSSRPVQTTAAGAELLFAAWMLTGLFQRATRWAAVACFATFLAIAVTDALGGAASCACFGSFRLNPWYAAAFDAAAVAALLAARPAVDGPTPGPRLARRLALGAAVVLGFGVPGAFTISRYDPVRLSDDEDVGGDGASVVLGPAAWVGKCFPLGKHIDVGGGRDRE